MVVGIFQILKTLKDIELKLKSYLHHRDYELRPLVVIK